MKKLALCLAVITVVGLSTTVRAQFDDDDLVPVPEPASFTLLALGAAGLAGYKLYSRRR